jgi:hypothetical protein
MDWINVKDKLPKMGEDVLVFNSGIIFHAFWDRTSSIQGDWYDLRNMWILENVTHWMPLPLPPHKDNE